MKDIGKGDLRTVSAFTGDREHISSSVNALINGIKNFLGETQAVRQALAEGDFSYKPDSSKYGGDWARAVVNLNEGMSALNMPLENLRDIGVRLAKGESPQITSHSYRGGYSVLFQSLEQVSSSVAFHNKELLAFLEDISRYSPGRGSIRHDYNGAFQPFKSAVDNAAERIESIASAGGSNAVLLTAGRPVTTVPRAAKTAASAASSPTARTASLTSSPAMRAGAASSAAPSSRTDAFTSAQPNLNQRLIQAPSAAKIYDAKDFGKY
jgi:hypothetical protein